MQFGRLRRANPPQTRPIECRTLPQSAAQNTFRILLFSPPPLSPLCRTDLRPPIFARSRRSRSLARGQSRGHPTLSDVRNSAIPVALDPMGFQWQIPPSVRFQISEITEGRRFNCNCRPPPIRFPPFSRAVRDKIDLPRSTRPLILPIPFPHSLRRAIFGRIMGE